MRVIQTNANVFLSYVLRYTYLEGAIRVEIERLHETHAVIIVAVAATAAALVYILFPKLLHIEIHILLEVLNDLFRSVILPVKVFFEATKDIQDDLIAISAQRCSRLLLYKVLHGCIVEYQGSRGAAILHSFFWHWRCSDEIASDADEEVVAVHLDQDAAQLLLVHENVIRPLE